MFFSLELSHTFSILFFVCLPGEQLPAAPSSRRSAACGRCRTWCAWMTEIWRPPRDFGVGEGKNVFVFLFLLKA